MIETLISSKTRIKLLFKFFLNTKTKAYLRSLETEFGESSNAIRVELNRLEEAGMLSSEIQGNKKFFQANVGHPLFHEIHNIVKKHLGFDTIIDQVISNLGEVNEVYVIGSLARGIDSPIIDLLLVGDVKKEYLTHLIEKSEQMISRKIRYIVYDRNDFEKLGKDTFEVQPLLIWKNEQ